MAEKKEKVIQVRVSPQLEEKLKEVAQISGNTISEVVRQVLSNALFPFPIGSGQVELVVEKGDEPK